MRNASNRQQSPGPSLDWSTERLAHARMGRSVSHDMAAIFDDDVLDRVASGPAAPVRTIAVGQTVPRRKDRRRTAVIAGSGVLLLAAASALVTTLMLPGGTIPLVTSAEREGEPRPRSPSTASDRAPAAQEVAPDADATALARAGGERTVAPVETPNPAQDVAASSPAPSTGLADQIAAVLANVASPTPAPAVSDRPQPAPRVSAPPRTAPAAPAPAREGASPDATRVASSEPAVAEQRSRAERVQPARRPVAVAAGPVTGARLLSGRIRDSDYPQGAYRDRAEGTVFVRFAVQPDGRVGGCTVTRSSGHGALDATTCQLIRKRFRYQPARDARGRAVPDVIVGQQDWWLDRSGRGRDQAEGGTQGDARPGSGRR